MKTWNEGAIHLDQIGYLPADKKTAVFKQKSPEGRFEVVSVEGKVVFRGGLTGPFKCLSADEEVYLGDFSDVTEEGSYQVTAEEVGCSYIFKIAENVYHDVFKDIVRFFYLQRCGETLPEKFAGRWAHEKCHDQPAIIYGTTRKIDVSGGWHDAGDYGRYVTATSKVIADLLLAYETAPRAFEQDFHVPLLCNDWPYPLEEIARQLKWMMKIQDAKTGGVYHKVTCAHFPLYDVMPQEETAPLIVCPISTTATGTFAAVMAMGYEYLRKLDSPFAEQCLIAAERAWEFLRQAPHCNFRNPEGVTTGEYGGNSDLEERFWASAQLFKATNKLKYKKAAEMYIHMPRLIYGYGWSAVGAYGRKAYLQAKGADEAVCHQLKKKILEEAHQIMKLADEDGYGITQDKRLYFWGSNMYFLMFAVFLSDAYEIEKNECYLVYAKNYIHYCFGRNPLGICYVTGYGTKCTQHPHHRPSIAQQAAPSGMLAGGANSKAEDPAVEGLFADTPPAKCYLDSSESFSTNEVDIYWNSMLVYAMARANMI